VLLSTVDHYNRVAKDTKNRVVGVLLGSSVKGVYDVTNSYAVPFDEESGSSDIWFLDHNFHEAMYTLFKKVNAREQVIGWYSTGPKIKSNDFAIHKIFERYHPKPIFCVIDVQPKELGLPTKAYVSAEEVKEDGTSVFTFQHIKSSIGALEAEEVGVEHLLRDIKDMNISTLASEVHQKVLSVKHLHAHLEEMHEYLQNVIDGRLKPNQTIINQMQDIFSLLPNYNIPSLAEALTVKSNDMMVSIYLSSLIRSVIALHNLINNKIANIKAEKEAANPKPVAKASDKEKDDKEKKDST